MANAAFFQGVKRYEPSNDKENIVSACYAALVIYVSDGVETQQDVDFIARFNKTDTIEQVQQAIIEALKKRAEEVTGTPWDVNDIYQFQIRRG